jgi:CelD/BcsL family acetyltransferase involved in cellulose biosynthesis
MIRALDPVTDRRWRDLVQRDPRASAFHTPEWLDALRRTYGFAPVVYAADPANGDLTSAIPFCGVASWLTGRRLVSLPFSDHCDPLVEDAAQLATILGHAAGEARRHGWRYVQIRPRTTGLGVVPFELDESNYHYALDLRPDAEAIFNGIKKQTRYDIRRAERGTLRHVVGRDDEFVGAYFRLHVMTRSTQGVPPQPLAWFRNVARCLGDMVDVHLLLDDGRPIAGLFTILFGDQLMWKYSASDPVRDRLGMGKSLAWQSIRRAKERGATTLDMGRCETANVGLAQFKERWGAARADLGYFRYPAPVRSRSPRITAAARLVVQRLPSPVLAVAGRLAYRHVA